MIRSKGEAGTGNVVEAVRHLRSIIGDIRSSPRPTRPSVYGWAKQLQRPDRARAGDRRHRAAAGAAVLRRRHRHPGRRRAGDAAGRRGGVRRLGDLQERGPGARARAIVEATTHFEDAEIVAKVSRGLGDAMPGLEVGDARPNAWPTAAGRADGVGRRSRCLQVQIGVLALQGDVAEHTRRARRYRRRRRARCADPTDLDGLDGHRLARWRVDDACRCCSTRSGLRDAARQASSPPASRLRDLRRADPAGRPRSLDGRADQRCFGASICTVRRNGYGRQRRSFECDLEVAAARRRPAARRVHPGPDGRVERAPRSRCWLAQAGHDAGAPCRQGRAGPCARLLVTAFHPELTADRRVHELFVSMVETAVIEHRKSKDGRTCQVTRNGRPPSTARLRSDKARAKVFAKLIRQLEVAAREGGGDINSNATLRTMFEKARAASVPLDTIERAIKRGTGELEGVHYEEVAYEGYAPGGVAIIVESPDRQPQPHRRRGPQPLLQQRRLHGRAGRGGLAVRPQGRDRAAAVVRRGPVMEVAVEAGAEDLTDDGDQWVVTCAPADLACRARRPRGGRHDGRVGRARHGAVDHRAGDRGGRGRKVLRLLEALDDHDDVQNVWSNFDIPDEVLAAAALTRRD